MKISTIFKNLLLFAIVILFFTSCEKDGVYNPKKKIHRILIQQSGAYKQVSETWIWDKNELSKIKYSDSYFIRYEYEKKQVVKIIDSYGNYCSFTYKDSKIEKMETFEDGENIASMTFLHDGKKISEMHFKSFSDMGIYRGSNSSKLLDHVFKFMFPEHCSGVMPKLLSNEKSSKASIFSEYKVFLTWDKDNIKTFEYEISYEDQKYTETYAYTYDKKQNPFYGFLSVSVYSSYLTKNNVLTCTVTNSENQYGKIEYSYRYEQNFPIEQTQMLSGLSATTFYEYY